MLWGGRLRGWDLVSGLKGNDGAWKIFAAMMVCSIALEAK